MRAVVENNTETLLGTLEAVLPDQFPMLKKLVQNSSNSLIRQLETLESSSSSDEEEEEEEVEMKLEEDSSSSSSASEHEEEEEEEEDEEEPVRADDFVVDDRAKLKTYDAKLYDEWVRDSFLKDVKKDRERKRVDRFDPSSSSSIEVHDVEVIGDEGLCITKAARDDFAHFVKQLHKEDGFELSDLALNNRFYRNRFGDALDIVIRNTGFENPKAAQTVRTILDWSCSDQNNEVTIVTGVHNNSHSKCSFCGLPKDCLAQVIVSQSRFPLGMSCMRVCKAIIAFGKTLWEADGSKDSLHLVDRAFQDILKAQEGKNKNKRSKN